MLLLMCWNIFFVETLHRVSMNYECITLNDVSTEISYHFLLPGSVLSSPTSSLSHLLQRNVLRFHAYCPVPPRKDIFWRLMPHSLSCINTSSFALSPSANRKHLSHLHFITFLHPLLSLSQLNWQ